MKKIFTLFLSAFALFSTMNAEEVIFDFSTEIPTGWTSSPEPKGFEKTGSARGAQYTGNATLTLTGAKGVSKVVVICSTNLAGQNTLSTYVGETQFGKTETLPKENDMEKTFTGSSSDGDIRLVITRKDKSIYIKKVVVTCDEIVINGGGGESDDEDLLDENYTYGDTVSIKVPSNEVIYNKKYQFIQNNILIKCTKGTHQDGYFSCAAGEALSIYATRPILAVSINGMVKKAFEAKCDAGKLYFAYDDLSEVTQSPVLYIDSVNAKSVTITCDKQIQCQEIIVYFTATPDLDLEELFGEEGGDEGYTYKYESTEVQTLTPEFDELDIVAFNVEMSEEVTLPFVNMYFESEDKELLLQFIAEFDANTGVTPGVYPIDTLLAVGHIVASCGGDEDNDYPSYLITDYREDDEYAYWNSFYLVSGIVTVAADPAGVKVVVDAKSYFGSTIQMTYVGPFIDYSSTIENITADPAQDKQNNKVLTTDGKFYIQRGNLRYNAQGLLVR
ncbi:MAG: hypothetical protein J6Y99_11855 [Bacteroidales bacterium]|nr:hypothetical protein [Bacteroidales bacterium]